MDLCVLIPNEFNLSNLNGNDETLFNRPTFWLISNCKIEKGKKFKIFDGEFRLGKIKQDEVLSYIPKELNDLDFDFLIENRRHCDWIKFLTVANQLNDQVNLLCYFDKNEFIFETTKKIEENCQINVYFDFSKLNDNSYQKKPVLENEILKKKLININLNNTLFIQIDDKQTNQEDLVDNYENIFKRKKNDSVDKNDEIDNFKRIKSKNFFNSELIENNDLVDSEKKSIENVNSNDVKFCSPINLVKKPKNLDNYNEEITKAINNIKTDRDSLLNQTDNNLVEFHQFTAKENCVNENEITLKENSSTSTNLSAINNSKRPHPFSYHRNKTCNTRSNMLPCEVCGKAFDRPSLLRRHMRTHTGEKPHVCDVCGKGFSTSSSLNTHRRIHSGEKPHGCPTCGKKFTASSNLYYHRMTHTKNKPHKCTLCEKSFPTPGDLKSHAYTHNGNWPHKCQLCGKGFAKQNCLKTHLFLHTGNKPHVCSVCNKSFALESNLRAHYKTHQNNAFDSSKSVDLVYRSKAGSTDANSDISSKNFIKQNTNNTSPIAALYSNALSSINKDSNKSLIDTLSNLNSFKNLLSCNNLENNKTCDNNSLNLTDNFVDKDLILKTNYNNLISSIFSQSINTAQTSSRINNSLNLLNQLPLTPTDSPINSSTNLALPWLLSKQTEESHNQQLKNNFDTKDNLFQNLTGNLLMSNNLFPQICQNNTQNLNDNLQQQLILMATTAQLLSLKHK